MPWTDRTRMLIGQAALDRLAGSHVAVFGLGGVGGYVLEALVRCGVGKLTLIDGDMIDETNINRQILATRPVIGMAKAKVARHRALEINPDCDIQALELFYCADNEDKIDFSAFDYVADCIDTVASKLIIIEKCISLGVPVLSSMGTGNKLDASKLVIADIGKTSVCPLARVMRRELRKRGIEHVKTLFSTEEPLKSEGMSTPGSVSFVPSAAGLLIAGEIIRDLIGDVPKN